jgi:hypothetical protein
MKKDLSNIIKNVQNTGVPLFPIEVKIWTWKNPLMLHWIMNPGLVFNELILGQRIPKMILIETGANKNLEEKTKIPCPHCGILHPGTKWSTQNKTNYGNYFGLYCDNCGKIIPCIYNLTSLMLLTLTFPIWYWFKEFLKMKWIENQRGRFKSEKEPTEKEPTEYNFIWWKEGLKFSIFSFIFENIISLIISNKMAFHLIPLIISGLTWGLLMKSIFFPSTKKTKAI